MELGSHIKSARTEVGITQGSLAELAGVSPSYIKGVENGHPISLAKARKITALLGYDLDVKISLKKLP